MNDTVKSVVLNDLRSGKLSHAILLDGGTQADRLALTRDIAQALVCESDQPPCGHCAGCKKAASEMHPDIFVYTGGTTVGSFKVDTVREIRMLASILPNEANRKVFILDNAQSMAAGAQNALLKVLEEPPSYVTFILTCPSHTQLLQTILSRVSLYSLPDQDASPDDKQAQTALQIAESILLAAAECNEWAIMQQTGAFEKDKELFLLCCRSIAQIAVQAIKAKLTDCAVTGAADRLASAVSLQTLYSIRQTANDTIQLISGNTNGNLLLSVFCARMIAANE